MRPASRGMVTIAEALTAEDARKISCYSEIDYAINEDAPVLDAVQMFSAYNIGCLVTTDSKGRSLESLDQGIVFLEMKRVVSCRLTISCTTRQFVRSH